MSLHHLTLATDGRNPLCRNEEQRRVAVRTLARIALLELVLFCIVDEHLHAVLWGTLRRLGQLRSALTRALRSRLDVPIQGSDLRDVKSRAHLEWLVKYVVSQTEHHGLAVPTAPWTGSCFQDLVGARVIDGLVRRTQEAPPRPSVASVCGRVGRSTTPTPVGDAVIRELGAARLLDAASAALCASPTLTGRSALETRVRDTVAVMGAGAGISTLDLAWVLRITPSATRRHLAASVDKRTQRAVRVRLALERQVFAMRQGR